AAEREDRPGVDRGSSEVAAEEVRERLDEHRHVAADLVEAGEGDRVRRRVDVEAVHHGDGDLRPDDPSRTDGRRGYRDPLAGGTPGRLGARPPDEPDSGGRRDPGPDLPELAVERHPVRRELEPQRLVPGQIAERRRRAVSLLWEELADDRRGDDVSVRVEDAD